MMQLTLRQAKDLIRQELGRDPAKSTYEALINEAGERWVNSENWRYLRQRTKDVQLQAGVEVYDLGAGIHSIAKTLHRPDSVWAPLELIEFGAYTEFREQYLSGIERPFNPMATTTWGEQAGDQYRKLYLHVYPLTLTERLVVEYRAGWLPMEELDDAADLPGPLAVHFRDWLRVYALHREFPEMYPYAFIEQFKQSGSFLDAQRLDAEIQGTIRVQGGMVDSNYQRLKQPMDRDRWQALRHYYERGGFPG